MPIEKQKLNTLNKLIDHGVNTEKKITAMGIQEKIAVPKITVPEIHIITELQDAIKTRSTIAYLAAAEDEDEKEKPDETRPDDVADEEDGTQDNAEDDESEVQEHGRFHF